jgi:glycine/D-amino acid oxidase-like deaminating enzyme
MAKCPNFNILTRANIVTTGVTMGLAQHSKYVIIGAGIHGLSTAYHLACDLKATGKGSGSDIVVLDKSGVAAGASGIACGVIRNNYYQPAMRELMAHSVKIWETDPKTLSVTCKFHAKACTKMSLLSMSNNKQLGMKVTS